MHSAFSPAVRPPAGARRSSGTGRLPSSFARREATLARVLFRHRVDYRMGRTTVGHGCTMDADSGVTDHAARSRRGTIAARGFRISEVGVLTRRLAPGATAAATIAVTPARSGRTLVLRF